MITVSNVNAMKFEDIPIDPFWNIGHEVEHKIHRIHAYPAKFPAFITTKAISYAREQGLAPKRIADIFCGCGTVAFESRRAAMDFWGCDLNPVATLIAKVKSRGIYQKWRLEKYYQKIISTFHNDGYASDYGKSNPRLQYWFDQVHYCDLAKLKNAIQCNTPVNSDYQLFFICAFSNILKSTSRWLTKSIKPQVDPNKKPIDVLIAFRNQVDLMIAACDQATIPVEGSATIVTANFLGEFNRPCVDLIITSPPYVTSYEYADLHQLSSLWLDYAQDYRDLRTGSIGSLNQDYNFKKELKRLNNTGHYIVSLLMDHVKDKARDIAKYYLDMQAVAQRSYDMLSENGMAVFVIGNTEYKGVHVDNAKHLSESLLTSGFQTVLATKRKISNKILTPYRDEQGRFSSNSDGRKIYAEEFIIIGRK